MALSTRLDQGQPQGQSHLIAHTASHLSECLRLDMAGVMKQKSIRQQRCNLMILAFC